MVINLCKRLVVNHRWALVLFLGAVIGVWPADAADLSHGPLVSAVTGTTANVWVRTSAGATNLGVEVRIRKVGTSNWTYFGPETTSLLADFTATVGLSGLSASTDYEYEVLVDGANEASATFTTFPATTASPSFKFSLLSDLRQDRHANVLATLALEDPAFVIILGDYYPRRQAKMPCFSVHRAGVDDE